MNGEHPIIKSVDQPPKRSKKKYKRSLKIQQIKWIFPAGYLYIGPR